MYQIKIGFLGYGTKALDFLMKDKRFDVRYFLTPQERLCEDVYAAREKYKDRLSMEIVKDNRELEKKFSEMTDVDCFLMNACSIILDAGALSKMKVFNIHPGDLAYNRGHQPHCWTVRLGEKKTKIVMHTVSEKIDVGKVIKSVEIPVAPDDSATDVLNHAEEQIPVLLDGLYQYMTGEASFEDVISEGAYRKMMTYKDYEIDFAKDSREEIKRKILSRSMNHGAFFLYQGKRIYVDRILYQDEKEKTADSPVTIRVEEKQGLVFVHCALGEMVFRLRKTELAE